jgi:hypothetical protein
MSGGRRPMGGDARASHLAGGVSRLNLIHTNNCSKPASMRVAARFGLPAGVDLARAQAVIDFAFGPLGELMLGRRLDGR